MTTATLITTDAGGAGGMSMRKKSDGELAPQAWIKHHLMKCKHARLRPYYYPTVIETTRGVIATTASAQCQSCWMVFELTITGPCPFPK